MDNKLYIWTDAICLSNIFTFDISTQELVYLNTLPTDIWSISIHKGLIWVLYEDGLSVGVGVTHENQEFDANYDFWFAELNIKSVNSEMQNFDNYLKPA